MIDLRAGDCRDVLATLAANSVQCVVTSPPYYGLRDYGVANQIGLEATPDEYLATMVAVFREVRRVLRDDGTCWVNMGDSYAGSATNLNSNFNERWGNAVGERKQENGRPDMPARIGKPKDLLMMPARLALALQAPYYAGRIKNEIDRVWLAAMIDGEGCFYIHRRPAGQHAGDGYYRTQDSYQAAFEVANTSERIVQRCMDIAGCGSISRQEKDRRQPLYRWTVRSNEARAITREIYPHLVAKQHQARLICGTPPSGKAAEAAWSALKAMRDGSTSDVDFAKPESMLEPGWFVRSDVIWSKPNPMPESVTDRPTSAHEHVFLLTKRATYYYDADAVREAAEYGFSPQSRGNLFDRVGDRYTEPARGNVTTTPGTGGTRNLRNVWTIATAPFSAAHFATFPPALAERCIKAGTSDKGCCGTCGAPWARVTEETDEYAAVKAALKATKAWNRAGLDAIKGPGTGTNPATLPPKSTTTGWAPGCRRDAPVVPCTVLDPFAGAGTTLLVADRLQRNAIGIELNPEYTRLAMARCVADAPLFTSWPPADDPADARMADLFEQAAD